MTPGLMLVSSKIKNPSAMSEEQFNRYYNTEHIPKVLASGRAKVALRYQNSDPSSENPHVTLYHVEDVHLLAIEDNIKFAQETRLSRTFHGQDIYDLIQFGIKPYEKFHTHEGYGCEHLLGKDRGRALIAVTMEPADGGDDEFDEWYRKQRIPMLSMCKGYRRTTRYGTISGASPRFLALHEFACDVKDLPDEQRLCTTEWTRQILDCALFYQREDLELVRAQGDTNKKL